MGLRKLLPLLCLLLVAAGCVGGGRDEILVGAVYPTGGTQGPGGTEEYRGVELAAERANALRRDGAPAVRLRLEPAESADAAPAAVDRLAEAGVPVVVGSYGSTVSRPAARTAERHGIVFWETGAVGEIGMAGAPGRLFFRFAPTGGVLGREAVSFVREEVTGGRPLRYAVTYVDDVYGRSVGRAAAQEARRSGMQVVAEIPYDLRTADYDAIAGDVADAGADVLVVAAYFDDGVEIRRAVLRRELQLDAMIGTSSSYCMPAFGETLGPDAVGVFASDKPDADYLRPDALRPEAAELLDWAREEYRRRYEEPMSGAALSGFAAGWALFAHVLPEADALTADGIAAAARRVRLPSGALPNGSGLELAGPDADEPGANLRASSVVWQWQAGARREIVWPESFRTAPLQA